jgi:pyruvate/2-oxoglutarate dehydrogenase complex dihydrolipoamide acyltransferase (E2) component
MFQNYQIAYLRRNVKVKEARPFSFLREAVAYVLSQSARKIPHAAAIAHFDVTPLIEYGKTGDSASDQPDEPDSKASRLRRAVRRVYTAFFVKAIAHSLHHVPELNGFLDYAPLKTGGTLYVAEDINVSLTVHTKYGVLRPIIRDPHKKDLETVANEMRALTRKARRTDPEELYREAGRVYLKSALRELDISGFPALFTWLRTILRPSRTDPELRNVPREERLQVTDILGATCTVASIGMMMSGHQTVTVIIPPEVMMFGIGDIRLVPWIVDGEVVPRHVITVAATMDHRAFDAGQAFPVYHHFKRYVDDPALIYEWRPGDEI